MVQEAARSGATENATLGALGFVAPLWSAFVVLHRAASEGRSQGGCSKKMDRRSSVGI